MYLNFYYFHHLLLFDVVFGSISLYSILLIHVKFYVENGREMQKWKLCNFCKFNSCNKCSGHDNGDISAEGLTLTLMLFDGWKYV